MHLYPNRHLSPFSTGPSIEGVPGKMPLVTSDKLLDSPYKLPRIPL